MKDDYRHKCLYRIGLNSNSQIFRTNTRN